MSAQPAATAQQTPPAEWRRAGNTVVELGLASPAGGRVHRAWFSSDGAEIYALSDFGRIWKTADLERWSRVETPVPAPQQSAGLRIPGAAVRSVIAPLQSSRAYAAGRFVWRSDDGGASWNNVTAYDGASIIGSGVLDVAVSPVNPDEVVVCGESGIWRSVDGGESWHGLNEGLPNFPATRLLESPAGVPEVRVGTERGAELVWASGERAGWRPVEPSKLASEFALLARVQAALGRAITAAGRSGEQIYAGDAEGQIYSSPDGGQTWRPHLAAPGAGRIIRIVADSRDPLFALALTDSSQRGRVLRTVNGGTLWDDITGALQRGAVRGIAADTRTGAVYLATSEGVFMTYTDTLAAAPPTPWVRLREEPALDVMLDSAGNQLYVLLEGAGVAATLAPHRARDPRVVSAGDRVLRAAAPGSLLSVLGTRVESARAGQTPAAVLHAKATESQVQLPFELSGTGVVVSMDSASGRLQIGLPVAQTSPAVFIGEDGTPLIMDADTGLMLDASTPARSNMRLQILATGLGRVNPNWPIGLEAPLENPPRVVAPVRVYLDREPLEVTSATLAPGYVGFYVVEARIPAIVNSGTAELYLEAGEESSNRVKVFIEP